MLFPKQLERAVYVLIGLCKDKNAAIQKCFVLGKGGGPLYYVTAQEENRVRLDALFSK